MSLRLNGSISGYSELEAPAIANDQTFTLPGTGGTLDRLNRAGNIIQVVEANTTTFASTATAIPVDNTIPQNTEGAEAVTVSITPTSSSNKLYICANIPSITASAAVFVSSALFQDSTANALSSSINFCPAINYIYTQALSHYMTAGTTSSTTFKLRFGPSSGTAYINGFNSGQAHGGALALRLVVMEIAA